MPRIARIARAACLRVGVAAAATLLLASCYVGSEGSRYLSIVSKAVSLDRALADPKTKPEVRLLIERAQRARAFAVEELGLADTRNYQSIAEVEGDRLATVVQACASLSFDRHYWSYPFVGKLPYRGYFDPKDAKAEAARLEKEGLDAIARPVDAFSTLGFIADPLFSFMASYDEAEVADLVIHEMTHATVFVKGEANSQFNEELATFVGSRGSLLFLERERGAGSPELRDAEERRKDARTFASFLAGTARELEAVYSSGADEGEKRRRKAEVIADRARAFQEDYGTLFETNRFRGFDLSRINNAFIDLYRLYEGDSPLYDEFCDRVCGGDLKSTVALISRIARDPKTKADPKAEMRRLVSEANPPGEGRAAKGAAE
jgi:predicted aminopeptidase